MERCGSYFKKVMKLKRKTYYVLILCSIGGEVQYVYFKFKELKLMSMRIVQIILIVGIIKLLIL